MFKAKFHFVISWLTTLCLLLPSLALAQGSAVPWEKLYGLGDVEYFSLANPKQGKEAYPYHIFVRLPEEYKAEDSTQYPTLYLLDAGTNFPLVAGTYMHWRWAKDIPPMIIVGISYGAHDWREGNDRSHDFTTPSKEREHWGGAAAFENFLIEKVMASIQNKYPSDPQQQILFGVSLGGQFGLYTSMYGKAPFSAVIASNPALHRNLAYFKQPLDKSEQRPKLFVSFAEFDDKTYQIPALEWLSYWQKQPQDWPSHVSHLKEHNHLSANYDALRDGLKWLFENNVPIEPAIK